MPPAGDTPKGVLRREIAGRLARLGQEEIERRSALACGHLVERFPEPGVVMAYLALPYEADPSGAIALWRAQGVRVCVPRVDWATKTMEAALLGVPGGELVETRYALREPGPGAPVVAIGEIDLVVVPGVAFLRTGQRLGRGGGFYDRFLARLSPGARTVGLVLSCQLVDELPGEPHDMGVGVVITEDGPV